MILVGMTLPITGPLHDGSPVQLDVVLNRPATPGATVATAIVVVLGVTGVIDIAPHRSKRIPC